MQVFYVIQSLLEYELVGNTIPVSSGDPQGGFLSALAWGMGY